MSLLSVEVAAKGRDGSSMEFETNEKSSFFDLDGTLLSANSGSLWMHRERRMGRLTPKQTIKGLFYIALYKVGFIDMEKVTVEALYHGGRRERVHLEALDPRLV